MKYRLILTSLIFLSLTGIASAQTRCCTVRPAAPVGLTKSVFGFDQTQFGGTHDPTGLTYGKQRAWDTNCIWGLIEATAGVYNFASKCNAFVNRAIAAGATPQFVMGRTPKSRITLPCLGTYSGSNTCAELPSDLGGANAILPAYINALNTYMTTTYPGQAWSIEGINEADLGNECAEDGAGGGHCSAVRLVKYQQTLFNTVKGIDATIQVLCPSASTFNHFGVHGYGGTDNGSPPFTGGGWANAGIFAYCDAMNVHPYFFANTPEEAVNGSSGGFNGGGLGQIAGVLSNAGKTGFPVESSETDWGSGGQNTMSDSSKVQWMGRYTVYAWNAGQKSIDWYEWECANGTLSNCFGTLYFGGSTLPAATALATLQDWFIGSSQPSKCVITTNTYSCAITLNTTSGKVGAGLIVFNNAGSTPTVSAGGAANSYRLDGTSTPIVSNQYTVDGQPTLLF